MHLFFIKVMLNSNALRFLRKYSCKNVSLLFISTKKPFSLGLGKNS